MNELIDSLKAAHASNFAFYLKAHNFHWNVEDDDFPMYHEFFGNLYEEVYSAVDKIAELIRTLDEFAPGNLNLISSMSVIPEDINIPSAEEMVRILFMDNQRLLSALIETYKLAEKYSEFGVSNAIQDRIEAHKKHAWMLRSMLKEEANG